MLAEIEIAVLRLLLFLFRTLFFFQIPNVFVSGKRIQTNNGSIRKP